MRLWGIEKPAARALLLAVCALLGFAQTRPANVPDVLIATTLVTPLTYAAVLQRLDGYYDEQVGRKIAVAFPEIAPNQHFEVWHDIWATFESSGDRTRLALKKMSDGNSVRIAKSYMLDLAGRLNADLPLAFKEEPGLRTAESEVCTSRKDLAAVLATQPAIRSLVSWQESGLFVSAQPLTRIALSNAGLHGARQLAVTTPDLAGAKALLAKLQQGATGAGICGVFSEEVELNTEIHHTAQTRSDTLSNALAVPTLYHPQMDLKIIEDRIRSDPAMQKRIAAAHGSYDVRFRVDKAYRKVTISWSGLTGYSEATGAFEAAQDLGQVSAPSPRKLPPATPPTIARVHLETLKAGAYRVRLTGEGTEGETVPIDERIFLFDGKTFEEPQNPGK